MSKATGHDLPPEIIDKPGAQFLYRNLPQVLGAPHAIAEPGGASTTGYLALAISIDLAMRENAPAGWRGDQPKESLVKNVLYPLLNFDRPKTTAVFELLRNYQGYK